MLHIRRLYARYQCLTIVLLINTLVLYLFFRHSFSTSVSVYTVVNPRVVLGIQADWQNMRTLVNASQHTWIPLLSYDLFYFVGRSSSNDSHLFTNSSIISLSVDDNVYPSVEKTFAIWSYFFVNHLHDYDYFIVVDSDTYVNVKLLDQMIKDLTCRQCYIGFPAVGEPHERDRLGLQAPYCVGMGYILSQHTLNQFGPHIHSCQTSIVARHTDTELGRCIYKYAHGLSCTSASIPFERVTSTVSKSQKIVRLTFNARHQMLIDFPDSPPAKYFRAVMVHPLKEARFFYHFHRQVILRLRPVLPYPFTRFSCVANPVIQQEMRPQKRYLPECPSPRVEHPVHLPSLRAFVITQPDHKEHLPQLIAAFRKHGISVKRFSANVTHSTLDLRQTMVRLFTMALARQLDRVLVLEDNAIPHRQLGIRLRVLLNESRCGGYLQDNATGGILMLGAIIWQSAWNILSKLPRYETGSCRNVPTKTSGSFAVVYHRHTFETILTWLSEKNDHAYELVFAHLARLGYPVRVATPNLVIADLTHLAFLAKRNISARDDPERRARIHRWKREDYMFQSYPHH